MNLPKNPQQETALAVEHVPDFAWGLVEVPVVVVLAIAQVDVKAVAEVIVAVTAEMPAKVVLVVVHLVVTAVQAAYQAVVLAVLSLVATAVQAVQGAVALAAVLARAVLGHVQMHVMVVFLLVP